MHILIINNSVIPALQYGGTERVIWSLGKGLVDLGHEVSYLVKEKSHCPFAKILILNPELPVSQQIPNNVDIVHLNTHSEDNRNISKPYLVTIHGNLKPNTQDTLDTNVVFVSKNHAKRNGSNSFVYNGLDWSDYSPVHLENKNRNNFHFLAKAAWRVKNAKGAIDIIKQTKNEKLDVLGGYRFNFKMGMRFTFSRKIRFHGMVGQTEKCNILQNSKGLIFPVKWHEPFGLAIIESLYYGCPVFGTPYGSLPELVDKNFGFLSNKSAELAEAIINSNDYSAKRCHEYAQDVFNARVMALAYLKKYEMVLSSTPLNSFRPLKNNDNNNNKPTIWI